MFPHFWPHAGIAILSLCLTGCSTTSRPGESNLFEAIHGLSSGRFEHQTFQDKSNLDLALQENYAESQKSISLDSTAKEKEKQLAALRAALDVIQKKNQSLQDKVQHLSRGNAEQRSKATTLKKRISQVNHKLSELKKSPEGLSYEDMLRQKTALQKEVDDLFNISE